MTFKRYLIPLFISLACVAGLLACNLFSNLTEGDEPTPTAEPITSVETEAPIEPTAQPTAPEPTTAPMVEEEEMIEDIQVLPVQVSQNEIALDGVKAIEEETFGPILMVQVTNPTDQEVVTTIPCGLIFVPPPESDTQRLMVLQEATTTLAPGAQESLTPYVICIDSGQGVPKAGSSYQIGTMAQEDLLKLAKCICGINLEQEVDEFGELGLQFTVWMISDGMNFDGLLEDMEEAEGALGEFMGEEFADMVGSFAQILEIPANMWLERCDIQVP